LEDQAIPKMLRAFSFAAKRRSLAVFAHSDGSGWLVAPYPRIVLTLIFARYSVKLARKRILFTQFLKHLSRKALAAGSESGGANALT
jgi:hypothetical protein